MELVFLERKGASKRLRLWRIEMADCPQLLCNDEIDFIRDKFLEYFEPLIDNAFLRSGESA